MKYLTHSAVEDREASPARSRRPKRIGSATKLRSGAMLFSIDGGCVYWIDGAAKPGAVEPDITTAQPGA